MQSLPQFYNSMWLRLTCDRLYNSVSTNPSRIIWNVIWKSSVTRCLAIAATFANLSLGAAPLLAETTAAVDSRSIASAEPALLAQSVQSTELLQSAELQSSGLQSTEFRPIDPVLISQALDSTLLQLDDSGEQVTQLQTRLSNLGYYDGPISGVFGELTQAAVINFQQRNGLSPDGIVGSETFTAIDRAATPTASTTSGNPSGTAVPVAAGGFVTLGDAGSDVTILQQRLTTLGYYQGAIDGQFGAQTEAALFAFQQAQGLNPDGIAGTATFSALNALTTPAAIATAPTTASTTLPPAQPDAAFPSPPGLGSQPVSQTPTAVAPIQPLPDIGVLELQRQLTRQGFYSGPLDGILSAETQQAIADAQRSHGINSDDLNSQF